MTKSLLNAACLSLLALVAIACGDPGLDEDLNVDEPIVDEFVDDEVVDDEVVDDEIVEELIAPFDNDSAANPAVDEFLSITNTREIVYTDQISAEDGDNEDFVQFELPNNSNPNQNMGISIDCDVFGDESCVRSSRAAQRRRQRHDSDQRRPHRLQRRGVSSHGAQ